MIRLAIAVACLTAVIVGPVGAEPSLRGYTGLIETPTADVLGKGQYNFGFNLGQVEEFDNPDYLGNYGIGRDLEVGLLWHHPEHHDGETLINLKHQFVRGNSGRPSFAVGIADLTNEIDTTVYAVGTWELGGPVTTVRGRPLRLLRLHAGVGGGAIDDFFFGAEARLGTNVNVMAEYLNSDFNVGARVRLWDRFSAQASVLDMSDLAVGMSYNWPLGGRTGDLEPITGSAKAREEVRGERVIQSPGAPKQPAPKTPVEAKPQEPAAPAEVAKAEPKAVEPPPPTPAKAEPVAEPPTLAEPPKPQEPEEATTPPVGPPKPDEPPAAAEAKDETPANATPPEPAKAAEQPPIAAQPAEPSSPPPLVEPEPPRDPFAAYAELDRSKPELAIPLDVCPEIEGGEVCVPVRAVAQWLGFRVNAETGKRGIEVTVFAGQDAVSFLIGDDRAYVGGETVDLPAPSYYLNQRTAMAPAKLFRLLGVPTETDPPSAKALFGRHDAVGVAECTK